MKTNGYGEFPIGQHNDGRYHQGCRCEVCTEAHRVRNAQYRTRGRSTY